MDAASELSRLAKEKFGELTAAEKKLFAAVANGETADYRSKDEKENDPAEAAQWDPSRVLNADRLTWLCTNKQALQLVTHKGIQVKGARIAEEFDLDFAKLPFALYFDCCKFTAAVSLRQAHMVGLYMLGTHTGPIFADGLKVEGAVFLRDGFKAEGEVRLLGAEIGGNLECWKSQFINKGGGALSANGATVKGAVCLTDGFKAEGEVLLSGAEIGRSLHCDKGQFINKGGVALSADALIVKGNVFLRDGFKAEGEVRLLGAEISGSLECDKGQFINKDGRALLAQRLTVKGGILLREGFKAEGEVLLTGAEIGGDIVCDKGQFLNKNGSALSAEGVTVKGGVFLRDGFKADGRIDFMAARIGHYFWITNVDLPESMVLSLSSVKIGVLYDDRESWPGHGGLALHGLEYEMISYESLTDSKSRIEWLRLQDGFWPQPYEHLAKVLREGGDGPGARDVLVAKNKDRAKRTKLTFVEKCWFRFFGPPIGYGHKPWLALPLALGIVLLGFLFFRLGYSHKLVAPLSKFAYGEDNASAGCISEVYPAFHSFVYSMDVFVPVVDLRQAEYWLPNPNRGPAAWLLLSWLWVETACGWVLTTLFLVGLTGLVRT